MIINEPTILSTESSSKMRGTIRWMAPELIDPGKFGFTGDLLKVIPSKSTDVYAIGMTILEVSTCLYPSRILV